MKNILIISLGILLVFFNEFSLVHFFNIDITGKKDLIKIRYFNFILIIFIIIIFFYWKNFLKISFLKKNLLIIILIILIDYISKFAGFGYVKNDYSRQIFPYDWFRGMPNVLDHNKFGFRGPPADKERGDEEIVIAFFGGSTGYNGDPTIIEILSEKLEDNGIKNLSINFSSVSSNHNQHMHRLIEFSEYKYDIIIFYGGGSETFLHFYYDPRAGYPYNYYIFEDNYNPLFILLRYSNIIGEIDKIFKLSSKIKYSKNIRSNNFNEWSEKIIDNYFNTIDKVKLLSENFIYPNYCKKTSFIPILEPLNIKKENVNKIYEKIILKLNENDVTNLHALKEKVNFKDIVHLDQKSKYIIADKIYLEVIRKIKENCN